MRIVYMGSPAEAVAPLEALAESSHEIIAVVTQPPRRSGRGRSPTEPPVADAARARGLPVWQPEKARDPEFLDLLRAGKPDVAVTCAYGQILTEAFLAIPRRGTINIHPSALPRHRGATPVPATLLAGETEAGLTIAFTVRALDAGAIIRQVHSPIGREETAGQLLARLFREAGPLVLQALDDLTDPNFSGTPQDEGAATHCRKIEKADGQVDWTRPRQEIWHRYRAFSPWPGSYTFLEGERITLRDFSLDVAPGAAPLGPGAFTLVPAPEGDQLVVGTGDGLIGVRHLGRAGRKVAAASAFWNGLRTRARRWDPFA